MYPNYRTRFDKRAVQKFDGVIYIESKVISHNSLNFDPEFVILKNYWVALVH